MAYGDKPKKRERDDMGNKGRKGKGPKPMKGAKKARRESIKQERENLKTENPVVNRSNDSGFDYTQSKKDIKKRYKKMDKGKAQGVAGIPHGTIARFQGSTKPIGDNKAMSAMLQKGIESGLSAKVGEQVAAMLSGPGFNKPTGTVKTLPSMTPQAIKQPLAPKMKKIAKQVEAEWASPPAKSKTPFKPSERDMELKEAHLGRVFDFDDTEIQTKKAGGPIKPQVVTKEGPKPKKPKSKSRKPKGRLKQKVKNLVTKKKRKISAKF